MYSCEKMRKIFFKLWKPYLTNGSEFYKTVLRYSRTIQCLQNVLKSSQLLEQNKMILGTEKQGNEMLSCLSLRVLINWCVSYFKENFDILYHCDNHKGRLTRFLLLKIYHLLKFQVAIYILFQEHSRTK